MERSTQITDGLIPHFKPKPLEQSAAPWEIHGLSLFRLNTKTGFGGAPSILIGDVKTERSELPNEFFNHQLKELAEGSDERILELSQEYGILYSLKYNDKKLRATFQEYMSEWSSSDPENPSDNLPELERAYQQYMEDFPHNHTDNIRMAVMASTDDETKMIVGQHDIVSINEIRHTAKMLRGITIMVLHILKHENVNDLASELPFNFWPTTGDPVTAISNAIYYLNEGLSEMSPILEVGFNRSRIDQPRTKFSTPLFEVAKKRTGTLTEAVAAQIYNMALSGLPVRTCDHCGMEFLIQQHNKPTKGRVRTGDVSYCSPRCKNAATQAARRKRVRERNAQQQKKDATK